MEPPLPSQSIRGTTRILIFAVVTYLVWVFATWLLEGRILTLLRPEAVLDRVNLYHCGKHHHRHCPGIVRGTVCHGRTDHFFYSSGFRPLKRTVIAMVIAFILGFILMILLNPPTLDPTVLLNVYAQVFTVSIAEITVCWAVMGSISEGILKEKGKVLAIVAGMIIASVLFGLYHFAHSPPFNQPGMVAFLALFGVVTSLVYFIGRDIYATMVFHNFFGSLGVMQSLATAGILSTYAVPRYPIIGTAIVSIVIFIAVDLLYVRKRKPVP